ncbi:MAG: indolepyruvate oxidoreductase subunit beta family protein [Rhodoferax sp.]
MRPPDQAISLLVCALGGEGGGVLSEWVIQAARRAGFPAQASSIPGVAQRTGSTTYYLEVLPAPGSQLQGRRPVFSLQPVPGALDLLVSSELLETARQVLQGHVSADRTLVLSSSRRTYTTQERMQTGDGRRDPEALRALIAGASRAHRCFDMQALAEQAGTVVSAVMLGAIAGSGLLPMQVAHYEAAIGTGRQAEASLRGFRLGLAAARGEPLDAAPPVAATVSGAPADRQTDALSDRFAAMAPMARATVALGHARVCDYQDARYGQRFLERVQAIWERDPTAEHALTAAYARWLALWMAFDDVIRVAELKARASRWERLAQEVRLRDGEILHVWDHFRPGADEIAGLLPPVLARRVLDWDQRRQRAGLPGFSVPLKIGRHTLSGMLALRLLRSLKHLRPYGLRFAEEQAHIDTWTASVQAAAGRHPALALEFAACGRLVKGYGATRARSLATLTHLMAHFGPQPDPEAAASALAAAREAALRNEADLDQTLQQRGAPARPRQEQPIRWVGRPPRAWKR